jgi:hypothetical protein
VFDNHRVTRARLLALVPIVALVGSALGASTSAAAASTHAGAVPAKNPKTVVTTIELHGAYSDYRGTRDSQHFCGQTHKYTIHYAETASTTDANLDVNKAVHWHFTKLTGHSIVKPDDSPACVDNPAIPPPCSAPISLRPGWEDSPSGQANISAFNLNEDGTFDDYFGAGYPPEFGATTQSGCGDVKGRFNDPGGIGGPYVIRISDTPAGHTKTTHKGVDVDKTTPGSDGSSFQHTHGHATLTVKAGQTGVKPPADDSKAREARKNAKDAAKADLTPALENAKGPCLNYALGLGLFGAGTLLTGAPAIGPTLTVAGSLTALAAEPFCVATIQRIAKDYKIYNDPPDNRIHQIARPAHVAGVKLPACKAKDADAQAFCRKVRPALITWVSKGQAVASVSSALSTTVNRLSAAINKHKKKGESAQAKQANKLVKKLHRAKHALQPAGAALAGIYRNAGLSMPLSHQRAKQAVGYLLKRLRRDHVTAKKLRSVSKKLLSTDAYDGLVALGAG